MTKIKNKQNGYIALSSIIIIGAIVLILTLAVTAISLSEKISTLARDQATKSYFLANTCANIAISKLQADEYYAGSETINTSDGSCYIDQILGTGNNDREFITSSTNSGYTKMIKVFIDRIEPDTKIITIQEYY